ncbi:hypothetical protein ACJX0J_005477, partial [Zea mays]
RSTFIILIQTFLVTKISLYANAAQSEELGMQHIEMQMLVAARIVFTVYGWELLRKEMTKLLQTDSEKICVIVFLRVHGDRMYMW